MRAAVVPLATLLALLALRRTAACAPCRLGAVLDGERAWVDAGRAHDAFAAGGDVHVELPVPGGGAREFRLREMDVLPESIRTKYPELHSYVGVSVDDGPRLEAAVSFSASDGVSLQVHGNGVKPLTIDPAGDGSRTHTIRDEALQTPATTESSFCGTQARVTGKGGGNQPRLRNLQEVDVPEALKDCPLHLIPFLGDRVCNPAANIAACDFDSGDCCSAYATCMSSTPSDCQCVDTTQNFVPHRRYRLALAANREYAELYGGTEERVLSAMVALLTRVNAIMMRELSISFELVDGNERLIDIQGLHVRDTYEVRALQEFIDTVIGHDNYDIGHALGTFGGGMAADIGTVCSENKGGAISGVIGAKSPENLVAHEMGHQLGADHTMASCGGSATPGNQVEAGSGFSIMSYNGLCSTDNIELDQNTEYAFFHSASHDQIFSYLRNPAKGGSCGRIIEEDTPIERPSFTADLDFDRACDGLREPVRTCKIPKLTPFRLDALTVPRDDDPSLHFTWEQTGVAPFGTPQSLLHPQTVNTVLYASTYSTMDKAYRVFPAMETVLKGIDRVDPTERLPSLARNIDFALFVRTSFTASGSAAGGILGASFLAEEVTVQVLDEDPLRVEQPSDPLLTDVPMQVRWTGGTQAASTVRILLSIDGGLTFPIVLAPSVSNTGSADVTIPSAVVDASLGCGTGRARIKVESLDELEGCSFFAVNDLDVGIDSCGGALPEPEVQILPTPRPTFRPTDAAVISSPTTSGPPAPHTMEAAGTSGVASLKTSSTMEGIFDLVFTCDPGQRMEIYFRGMELHAFRDVVEVFDGHSQNEPSSLLARYEGSYSGRGHTVVGSSNALRVRFTGVLQRGVLALMVQYGPQGTVVPLQVLTPQRAQLLAPRSTSVERLPPGEGVVQEAAVSADQLRYWLLEVPEDQVGVVLDVQLFHPQGGGALDVFLDAEGDGFSRCARFTKAVTESVSFAVRARRVVLRFAAASTSTTVVQSSKPSSQSSSFRLVYAPVADPDRYFACQTDAPPKPYAPGNPAARRALQHGDVVLKDAQEVVLVPDGGALEAPLAGRRGVHLRAEAAARRLLVGFSVVSLPRNTTLRLHDGASASAPLLRVVSGPVDSPPFPVMASQRDLFVAVAGDADTVVMLAQANSSALCGQRTVSPSPDVADLDDDDDPDDGDDGDDGDDDDDSGVEDPDDDDDDDGGGGGQDQQEDPVPGVGSGPGVQGEDDKATVEEHDARAESPFTTVVGAAVGGGAACVLAVAGLAVLAQRWRRSRRARWQRSAAADASPSSAMAVA